MQSWKLAFFIGGDGGGGGGGEGRIISMGTVLTARASEGELCS